MFGKEKKKTKKQQKFAFLIKRVFYGTMVNVEKNIFRRDILAFQILPGSFAHFSFLPYLKFKKKK